ncbi:MAG: VOC family protein [Dehalococcoidia bacterium]|nr:VOC family protein [Dehalococcoidia bacterium]
MEPRISVVTFGVSDLGQARRFYEDGLDWKASALSNEEIVFFQAGSLVVGLFGWQALAQDANVATGAKSGYFRGITLAHNVRSQAEVDHVLKQAASAGARLLKPGMKAPWGGYSGYFADPDGHVWEVAWNPHSPIADDGSIRLPR